MKRDIIFQYTNHEGKTALRRVVPLGLRCLEEGDPALKYYPLNTWVLHAFDMDREDLRDFDLEKIERPQAVPSMSDTEGKTAGTADLVGSIDAMTGILRNQLARLAEFFNPSHPENENLPVSEVRDLAITIAADAGSLGEMLQTWQAQNIPSPMEAMRKEPLQRMRPHPMIELDAEKCYYALFKERAQHTGLAHLRWLYQRMFYQHKEPPNVDYMITFRDIIKELEPIEQRLGTQPSYPIS